MAAKLIGTVLVILAIVQYSLQQDIKENTIDNEDHNPFSEAAAAILKEQNAENIGGLVNSLLQSGGAKQLGDMLKNAAASEKAGPLLQGIGSMLAQGGGGGQGLDPNLLSAALGALGNTGVGESKKSKQKQKGDDFDYSSLLSMAGSFMGQASGGGAGGLLDLLPMAMQTMNSFLGPDALERAKSHADHAWLLPPILEKLHVFFDHFMHSELGKTMINTIGAEKFVKVFQDEKGRYSYDKFVEMMENQSFRRHWINMVTTRIATMISYAADPTIHKQYMSSFRQFINSILKSTGFPKNAMFDPNRPTETITAFVNHLLKTNFDMKINAKQYVKPAVDYVQELFRLAQNKGLLLGTTGVDSRQLSDKLTDTINLEIIEPISRVNRAYKFAKRVPKCDKYVMCLVNQEATYDEAQASLPGLKPLLSKSTSLLLSWFLSGHTGTSFWSLYHVITEENNCQARFLEPCNDFHVEEVKVTTEYVHNEL